MDLGPFQLSGFSSFQGPFRSTNQLLGNILATIPASWVVHLSGTVSVEPSFVAHGAYSQVKPKGTPALEEEKYPKKILVNRKKYL